MTLAGCARHAGRPLRSGQEMTLPVLPLALSHIPPVPTATPQPSDTDTIPMRIDRVIRHGRLVRVAWDAPGATQAVVSFSVDGATFRTVTRTTDPLARFALASPHGIIRIFVTDGKRRNTEDYRI